MTCSLLQFSFYAHWYLLDRRIYSQSIYPYLCSIFIQKQIKAFGYAFAGIASFFKTERNATIHALAAVVAIAAGFYFKITSSEWLWISLAITLVIISEMVNTAIEKLCNRITTEIDPEIKAIKDIAAGFVLIAALFSLAVAAIIFSPYLFNY